MVGQLGRRGFDLRAMRGCLKGFGESVGGDYDEGFRVSCGADVGASPGEFDEQLRATYDADVEPSPGEFDEQFRASCGADDEEEVSEEFEGRNL